MEQQTSKNYFQLRGGLNTELNELNFPDGYTTDEQNYEIMFDGSRRRRKGLAEESTAGDARTVDTFTATQFCQTYLWRDAGGLSDVDIMVYRQGPKLHFADADEIVSDGWYTQTVALDTYETSGATTANTDDVPVTFSQGRGYLFVSGLYIKPFYIKFDGTDTFSSQAIDLKIRDYVGVEDGIGNAVEPGGTITSGHRYNMRNRGWPEGRISEYQTDTGNAPPKNALWYRGLKRVYASTVSELDGTRTWDSAKLQNEGFGASSAPVGSLFIEPSDTTIGYGGGAAGGIFSISTWAQTDDPTPSTWTVRITTSEPHGLVATDEVTISGQLSEYQYFITALEEDVGWWSFDGTYTVDLKVSDTIFEIDINQPPRWDVSTGGTWIDQYAQLGSADSDLALNRAGGTAHPDSTRAIEFHQGRVFYAGYQNQEFSDYVFFSQIVDSESKIPRCYQENDPTDETFNSLVATDGGYIIIPGMSGVVNMVSLRDTLLIFAKEGVWEVSGGRSGVFTSENYLVRKITDIGCNAPLGMQPIEDSIAYSGPAGIYILAPNQFTRQLEPTSASEQTIQSLWNTIPDAEQIRIQMAYDNALRRLYLLYGPDGTSCGINTALIFDARVSAWFKYTFNEPANNVLLTGFAIPNADDTSESKKMKFIYQDSTTTVQVADFDQLTFDDWDGEEGPLPYMYTGWDNLGDFQRRRQAPVITVFSKRTERGFTSAGSPAQYTPVNPSSTKMSAYWDWVSDDQYEATTNKITATPIQVYRHVRAFAPSATTDLDGYPVVTTRNKVRGRGRVLQLKFEGEAAKDSHILGFTTNYKITRKK